MATIKPDPLDGNSTYQDGSGKFTQFSWHLLFALTALCLKSSSFCLRVATLSNPLGICSRLPANGYFACLRFAPLAILGEGHAAETKEASLRQLLSTPSMTTARVSCGAPACRPLAVMHERQAHIRQLPVARLAACAVMDGIHIPGDATVSSGLSFAYPLL